MSQCRSCGPLREQARTGDPGTPVTVRSALRPPRFAVDLGRPVNHAGRTQALPIAATMDMYSDSKFHTGLPVTPRITVVHGSSHASTAERGASLAAFLCCAWNDQWCCRLREQARSHRGSRCTRHPQWIYGVRNSNVGAGRLRAAFRRIYQALSRVRRTLSSSSLIWNGLISISMPSPRNTWRLIAVSA